MLAHWKQVAEESANNDDCPCTEQQFDSLVQCSNFELGSKCLIGASRF